MFQINKTVCDNGLSIYTSQITDNLSDLAPFFGANAETVINAAQRQFRSPHRLAERLTVEAMICAVMGKNARVSHTKSGRPYIECDNAGISISHSRTHAALLICNRHHCGVDIEILSPRILNVASRIALLEEESGVTEFFCEENRILALTTLWTIKEAVYKSVENQENFDILTDICVPTFCYDALISNKLQKNTVEVVRKNCDKNVAAPHLDVASIRLGNSILSYVAY